MTTKVKKLLDLAIKTCEEEGEIYILELLEELKEEICKQYKK